MSAKSRWLVRLYPRAWRERYEEEFAAMLEQRPASLLDVLDIVFGALDARLHPQLGNGRTLLVNRMHTATIAILCAYVGFVVAGMGFQKATEDPPFTSLESTHALLGISYNTIVAGSVVALLAMMAGGIPLVFAALRYALAERRRDILLLFSVPPISLAAFVGYVLLLAGPVFAAVGPLAVHDPLNVTLFLSLVGLFLLAAVASATAVSSAITRSEVSDRLYRFALVPGAVATLAMGVMLVATVVWGIGLRVYAPELFASSDGILATNTALTWLVIVMMMAASTCVADVSVSRGFSGRAASDAPL